MIAGGSSNENPLTVGSRISVTQPWNAILVVITTYRGRQPMDHYREFNRRDETILPQLINAKSELKCTQEVKYFPCGKAYNILESPKEN